MLSTRSSILCPTDFDCPFCVNNRIMRGIWEIEKTRKYRRPQYVHTHDWQVGGKRESTPGFVNPTKISMRY
jgi:hypothetical protein